MLAEFDRLRAGLTHSGARGDAAEEIVRDFLIGALPASLGVTVGQVVDSTGTYSGQSDVIVFDAQATPMLFRSAQGNTHTVPVEGVVAVIEVKSVLARKDLDQFVEHARRVKSLQRRAFVAQPIVNQRRLYEQDWTVLPIIYSVFAFTSDGLYVSELNRMQAETPLHLRVDNLCAMDRGLLLNVCLTGHVREPETLFTFSPTATRLSKLGEVITDGPLLPWFAGNASLYVQSDRPPIDLSIYVQDELRLGATMPSGDDEEFREELFAQMAEMIGVSVEIVRKIGTRRDPSADGAALGVGLSAAEILQLVDPFARGLFDCGPQFRPLFELLSSVPSQQRIAALEAFQQAQAKTQPAE